jgi:hypothetical protein
MMKVEQDLRIAIKAAAAASKNQDRSKSERVLIEEWLKKYPAKAAKARALAKAIVAADAAEQKAREQLEKQFGLNRSSWRTEGEFRMGDEHAFQKAGGEIGVKRPRFDENAVIAEYAATKTKQEAKKVFEKYGIVWE